MMKLGCELVRMQIFVLLDGGEKQQLSLMMVYVSRESSAKISMNPEDTRKQRKKRSLADKQTVIKFAEETA